MFSQVEETEPENTKTLVNFIELYCYRWTKTEYSKAYFDLAVEDYNKAIEIDKNNDHAYVGIANIYANRYGLDSENQELYDKAITYYKKAIALSPNKESYKSNLNYLKSLK